MSEPTIPAPFGEVVVGVDGEDGGRDAVALAVALGAHRLTLVGAHRYRMHDVMARALEATRLQAGVVADLLAVDDPSPARALHRVAQERGADLIVVGSAHHGTAGRLLLGDVSRAVLHDSPCPVAVAPRGYHRSPARAGTVAVGFDGGDESRGALALARRIAAAAGARLELHVVREGPTLAITVMAYTDEVREMDAEDELRAQRVLDEGLGLAGTGATGEVHEGSPATELARVSEHADLLVVGSRGWGPLRRVALGSTSDRVLHRAACPVVVVPRGAGTEPAPERAPATAAAS